MSDIDRDEKAFDMDEKPFDDDKAFDSDAVHIEKGETGDRSYSVAAAQHAADSERKQSLWQALKREPKSVFWSVAVSTAIIMEGYDIVLVTSLFAQPAFAKRYGTYLPSGSYQIPANWQTALGTAPIVGAVVGAALNGFFTHKFGYRKVLLASLVFNTAFIFLLFFATSLGMLYAGLILCGLPWGVFATMAPAYASEVCSVTLRGYLAVYVNFCWAVGQLIAAGVLEGFATSTSQWAYRIPFGIQWAFPPFLIALIWFAPESPWWLVRKGKIAEAKRALERLTSRANHASIPDQLALIRHTNEIEDEQQSGTRYVDCFRGTDLRRTEIVCLTWAAQIWAGTSLAGTPTYFFTQAGLSASNSFKFTAGGLGLACIGTIISWGLLTRFGRRTLYVWGLGILSIVLLITGIIAAAWQGHTSSFTQAGFIMAWLFIFYMTVGPVCYPIISETSAVRLRNKSVSLSRISYYISQIIGNTIEPYMINPGEADWHGKTAFFWAGTCFVFFVWAFFRLPETGRRTYEELDILFQARTPARKFSKLTVDAYAAPGERIKED